MITRYIKGDITETELRYIAHGVNCQNAMGSGVAKALYTKFPEVKKEYHRFCERYGSLPKNLLGMFDPVEHNEYTILNMFTQLNYGYDGERYVNYSAICNIFKQLAKGTPFFRSGPLAIPKIGCGLAGGDWNFVEQLINDTVGDDLEIWVYYLDEKQSSGKNDLA